MLARASEVPEKRGGKEVICVARRLPASQPSVGEAAGEGWTRDITFSPRV